MVFYRTTAIKHLIHRKNGPSSPTGEGFEILILKHQALEGTRYYDQNPYFVNRQIFNLPAKQKLIFRIKFLKIFSKTPVRGDFLFFEGCITMDTEQNGSA